MITNALLTFLNNLLSWVMNVRPSWSMTLPSGVASTASFLLAYDNILPITEIFVVIGGLVTLVTALVTFKWAVKIIDWIADVLP